MQIPILNGIYTDQAPDFRTSYPRNMVPVPKDNGIAKGYLRPADGIQDMGDGPGTDRGGIVWKGTHYRVMGLNLVSVSDAGVVTTLATVPGTDYVRFDYSFDRLAIAADGGLYYWQNITLTKVTDTDIGSVHDVVWVDGYFMITDGTYLIVTELNNPLAVNPLKYGSSEVDPDPVKGLIKLRDEVYAVNRNTIEVFDNVGGELFPFERIKGAQICRGAIGARSFAIYIEAVAFLGSGRNESPAVWIGLNSTTTKISTREIDTILQEYTEEELALVVVEAQVDKSHQLLYVHLPDRTLVYDGAASAVVQEPVWHTRDSGILAASQYRARGLVWVGDAWWCGDPTTANVGKFVNTVSTHYGDMIGWEFGTTITYNAGFGAIFHMIELVALPGRVPIGAAPVIWTSFSLDGETWSAEIDCPAGRQGERTKRLTWLKNGSMLNWRIQKFRGTSDAHMSVARLEIGIEPLNG